MRIAQIILPAASAYERKCQRVDHAALSGKHEVTLVPLEEISRGSADLAHLYATGELPKIQLPLPYVASAPMPQTRWYDALAGRRATPPRFVLSPPEVPEAVEDFWFAAAHAPVEREVKVVGSFARKSIRSMVDRTLSRISRFRSDVTWNLYDHEPTPEDLADVDAWIDPAVSENDQDGFVAEALVLGLPVVATRTKMNGWRLEQGRTGFLVPLDDPNEMTHAILTALFKVEVAENKKNAARQTVSKFRARQRLRILQSLYEQTIS
jgi:glycosyltransferase involved in cell wall biosynthesis